MSADGASYSHRQIVTLPAEHFHRHAERTGNTLVVASGTISRRFGRARRRFGVTVQLSDAYFFFFPADFFFAEDLRAIFFAAGFLAPLFAVFLTGFLAGFFAGVLAVFFFAAAVFARVSAGGLLAEGAAGGAVKVSGCSTFTRRTISPP
jgi:hypothetical protein